VGFCRLLHESVVKSRAYPSQVNRRADLFLHIRVLSFRDIVDCFEFSFEIMKGQVGPPDLAFRLKRLRDWTAKMELICDTLALAVSSPPPFYSDMPPSLRRLPKRPGS